MLNAPRHTHSCSNGEKEEDGYWRVCHSRFGLNLPANHVCVRNARIPRCKSKNERALPRAKAGSDSILNNEHERFLHSRSSNVLSLQSFILFIAQLNTTESIFNGKSGFLIAVLFSRDLSLFSVIDLPPLMQATPIAESTLRFSLRLVRHTAPLFSRRK